MSGRKEERELVCHVQIDNALTHTGETAMDTCIYVYIIATYLTLAALLWQLSLTCLKLKKFHFFCGSGCDVHVFSRFPIYVCMYINIYIYISKTSYSYN